MSRRPPGPRSWRGRRARRVRRQQQEAGGADAVGRAQHDVGRLEVLAPVGVEPVRAGARPRRVDLDATHARAGHEPCTRRAGTGPVGDVGRALGPFVAAGAAGAPLHAGMATVVGGQDRVVLRPPVPAEPGVGRATAIRRGRSAAVAAADPRRRVGGVAAQSGDAELPVGLLVERQQLRVRERPVVADAEVAVGAEVRRQQPRPHRAVQDRPAADAVEVAEHHLGVVEVDRVVGGGPADVGRRRPAACRRAAPSPGPRQGTRRGRASRPARGRRRGCRLGPGGARRRRPTRPRR